jgi:putative FmdB family regulatory protein
MPIYEYGCPDCGHQFDALQKFSDDPIRECPSCKALNVKKKISATSFVLKGSGWYKDHYGLKSGGGSESGSSGASATNAAPASTGGASSPAASAPAATPAAPAASSTPSTPAAPAK